MTENTCTDKKCPHHGSVSTRGASFDAVVVSDRMRGTVVVEKKFVRVVPKYNRYEKLVTRISAHNPQCINAKYGEAVRVEECRSLSKTVHFVVTQRVTQEAV